MRNAWGIVAVFALLLQLACNRDGEQATAQAAASLKGALTFKRDGNVVATRPLSELSMQCSPRVVTTHDPYYEKTKHFRALPLVKVLTLAFEETPEQLRKHSFVLSALDGYAVPVSGQVLVQDNAYLAFDDVDVPGFAPIGPRKTSPAPAYLIWEGDFANLETHPRPWQLATISIVQEETLYPHTVPAGEPKDGPAMLGFALFRERCIRCHAINREGGTLGPDLNVPQSIVQYRPEPQIRAYIKNPLTFRYGAMPAHPDLSETQLDQLIAYFRAMATRPHDPDAKSKHE